MTRNPMTLTEFLLARITEDEMATIGHLDSYVQRERAECEAKRRIITAHSDVHGCPEINAPGVDFFTDFGTECLTLTYLALPYVDHPDYRDEWKP